MFRSPGALQGAKQEDSFIISEEQNRVILLRSLKYYDLNTRNEQDNIWFVLNRNIAARLQFGPSCGLIALRMAMETLLLNENNITTEQLLKEAQENNYSNLGEMFFATHLASLGMKLYPKSTCRVIEFPSPFEMAEIILNGNLILVPYDAAGNHTPGLFNGTKAHWALIKGISCLITESQKEIISTDQTLFHYNLDSWNVLFHDFSTNITENMKDIFTSSEEDNFYFICQQGKSKNQAVWSYKEIKDSNLNLQQPTQSERDLLLPTDMNGLRNKIIIVSK